MNKSRLRAILGKILNYTVASVSFAIVLYILFALLFSTNEERRLEKENRLYSRMYSDLVEKEALIGDAVDALLEKDNDIYQALFDTDAPAVDEVSAAALIADSDSLSENFYLTSTATKSGSLMKMASRVEDNFEEVFRMLTSRRDSIPPLTIPLKNISYAQTGASTGMRRNPVHKLELWHGGLDIVAPQGAPVYAAASGIVSKVTLSHKGLGNTVEIDHRNGYITRYSLLGEVAVQRGRSVKRGQKIGTVGILSSVSAPHLHYEVQKDTLLLDPVNFFFASVSPEDYARMMSISVNTAQSMD